MQAEGTLLLRRTDVEELLSLRDCIDAVEEIFRQQGNGEVPPSGILGVKAPNGGLHVKATLLPRGQSYIVAKLNTNFPVNRTQSSLPTIQGLIAVYDAENGRPLAVFDSIEITIKRTAAASAVAAKYLARKNSAIATICGCGEQGRAQLRAIQSVVPSKKIYAFDLNERTLTELANQLSAELKIDIEPTRDLPSAIQKSDVCVTCTTASEFFVRKQDVAPGTFIASTKVVADSLDQSCAIGDTHHAIAQGLMRKEDVYAELGEIVTGKKSGRTTDDEIIIFDSTGVAMEDAVAAAAVYEKARASNIGTYFEFAAWYHEMDHARKS